MKILDGVDLLMIETLVTENVITGFHLILTCSQQECQVERTALNVGGGFVNKSLSLNNTRFLQNSDNIYHI